MGTMFLKSNERSFANGKNHINGIENFFSKRVRRIGSKQSAAKIRLSLIEPNKNFNRHAQNLRCTEQANFTVTTTQI